MSGPGHRRCVVLRGAPLETAAQARRLLALEPPEGVLWVSPQSDGAGTFRPCPPGGARRLLGQSFRAVVLDLHGGLLPDVLGQVHGLVSGGGALVLRAPPAGQAPAPGPPGLAALPFTVEDVGQRTYRHLERCLGRSGLALTIPEVLRLAPFTPTGTAEQARVVRRLVERMLDERPSSAVLTAERGRGKSSALGMALCQALARRPLRAIVTAESEAAAGEVLRFAASGPVATARFVPVAALAQAPEDCDVLVVDEAAQLPVPLLQRVTLGAPRARLVFATTTGGYEGTGRGFVLRFLRWLERQGRPVARFTLGAPIRWAPGDPLEALVRDALLLDAQPDEAPAAEALAEAGVVHQRLSPDALWRDEALLRGFFGLLVHAHYRTTAADLQRLLDAPNLRLHALRAGLDGPVIAATVLALEGGLDERTCERIYRGHGRVAGHALPETLISHLGAREAGRLRMVRSVRIATHPALRRLGLARQLVEHVHRCYQPDLFGTLFGATVELLQFRRRLGYELVRVGASRGSRTGEPAAVMLRPVSLAARQLHAQLRRDLARDLPAALDLHAADGVLVLEPALRAALTEGLPAPSLHTPASLREQQLAYAFGPRIFEAVPEALTQLLRAHPGSWDSLTASERALLEVRVLARRDWREAMEAARLPSVPAAMRALRRAVRRFVEQAGLPREGW